MISKITIKNFKSIQFVEVTFNQSFNVIIGENNIGKTTIFEAIHLWKMCYDLNIKKNKTQFYSKARNLLFRDMEYIRVYHDMDLFYHGCSKKDAETKILLEIEYNGIVYSLGFKIEKVKSLDDAYYQTYYMDDTEFQNFAATVNSVAGKNLANFIAISESRPIANIIAKEPYMYKDQILDKIAKGKGYEVLRNKIINHIDSVQTHVNNVMEKEYRIIESGKDNKTYITVKVDDKDIFSYGSGFLQLTEIFSSIEYMDAEIHLLLIDEPDSHLHVKLQKRLIEELRTLTNCQLLIISHNERFLQEVAEDEILFLSEASKTSGIVESLPDGCKGIVLENLIGCLASYEQLRNARKLILVEGAGDIDFFDAMCPKYESYIGVTFPMKVMIKMDGIDTLNAKLISYSRALKDIIPSSCPWLLIRDTDCVPVNKKVTAGNDDKKDVDTNGAEFKVLFQEGYGVESTFVSEPEKLSKMLCSYYSLAETEVTDLKNKILEINISYRNKVRDILDNVHKELKKHFERQLKKRAGRVYQNLKFEDMLEQISETNIQYIMTKPIMDMYLKDIHVEVEIMYGSRTVPKLDHSSIFTYYYTWMTSINDMFVSHKTILDEIYR